VSISILSKSNSILTYPEYNKKKAGKTKPAAKSVVILDVKPWGKLVMNLITCPLNFNADDETDMAVLEKNVRSISMDGLVWGASKMVEVGYGIKKLQINLVVEDEKVSIDELQHLIEEDEDHVQSTDVVSDIHLSLKSMLM
jgi:elongation factor 1-beta